MAAALASPGCHIYRCPAPACLSWSEAWERGPAGGRPEPTVCAACCVPLSTRANLSPCSELCVRRVGGFIGAATVSFVGNARCSAACEANRTLRWELPASAALPNRIFGGR